MANDKDPAAESKVLQELITSTEKPSDLLSAVTISTDFYPPQLTPDDVTVDGNNAVIKWGQPHQSTQHGTQQSEEFEICWWTDETDRRHDHTKSRNYMMTKLKYGETYSVNVRRVGTRLTGCSRASNTVHFKTAPLAPSNLRVDCYQASPEDSLIVSFDDKNHGTVEYEVVVDPVSGEGNTAVEKARNRSVLIKGLIPGASYGISAVTCDGTQKSERTFYALPVTTYPAIPREVDLKSDDGRLVLTWERPAIRPQKYRIVWESNGVKHEDYICDELFSISDLKPSTTYRFKVASVNCAGCGDFTEEQKHTTAPAAPVNISVTKNVFAPETSFIVKFADTDEQKKEYEACALSVDGRIVDKAKTTTHTAVLNNLEAGQPYLIYVVAISGDLVSEKTYFVDQATD